MGLIDQCSLNTERLFEEKYYFASLEIVTRIVEFPSEHTPGRFLKSSTTFQDGISEWILCHLGLAETEKKIMVSFNF